MNFTGTVACPECKHTFRVRWPNAPAPAAAPLPTSTALAVLQPKAARNPTDPTTLAARIVVWLARRVGARGVPVRTIYHHLHCRAEHCYAALRLLVRNGDVMLFAGPPPMVMLRTAPGAIEARPSATAGASSSTASTA